VGQDGTNWVMKISTGTGVTSGSMGTVPVTNAAKVLIADYDGDGRDDFIRPEGNIWYIHRSSGSAIEGTSSATSAMPKRTSG
jgi:hypothetical protein